LRLHTALLLGLDGVDLIHPGLVLREHVVRIHPRESLLVLAVDQVCSDLVLGQERR
jgi:hypothetical protein